MIISVGTKYEGASSSRLEDGDYELQITDIQSTKGRVNMTLTTSKNQKVYKTFFLLEKDGKTSSDKGLRELADYITTAMQIEDEEVQVDVSSALGFYLLCYVKNGSYTKKDENGNDVEKKVYNVYNPRRCSGFSDGTESFVAGAPSYQGTDEEEYEEVEEEDEEVEEAEEPSADVDGDQGDIFAKFGVQ